MTVTNNIYQKQIKYHVFNAVTNSELTKLVPVFTIRPSFPTSIKKVNTSFKNVWRTWGPALLTLLVDLMIFFPLGPIGLTNFKNSVMTYTYISNWVDTTCTHFWDNSSNIIKTKQLLLTSNYKTCTKIISVNEVPTFPMHIVTFNIFAWSLIIIFYVLYHLAGYICPQYKE